LVSLLLSAAMPDQAHMVFMLIDMVTRFEVADAE
jgi:hypothetical protein